MDKNFHKVGMAFKNKSKKGTDYLNLMLFKPAKEDAVKLLGFTKESKKGKEYVEINLITENLKKDLEKLKDHIDRHLKSLEGSHDLDNADLVENIL